MAKQNTKAKRGFTLIEVVLVLAIAGLILIMALVVWPRVQETARDRQRTQNYTLLSTSISNYNGKLSDLVGKDLDETEYINESGEDPDGTPYTLIVKDCNTECSDGKTKPSKGQVFVYIHSDCSGTNENDGSAVPKSNPSSKAFAVYGYLEGSNGSFCVASQ